MKEEIIRLIKELIGEGEVLYFDTSLLIKLSPHTWPLQLWAVSVKDERIVLMDGLQVWHELEETDINYSVVLSTLCQRVKIIRQQFKTVA